MKSIFNPKQVDYTKEPIFFGEELSVQRYDVHKHKFFFDMFQQQLSMFWRPEEVNVSMDAAQFKMLTPNEQDVFTKNLKYQILLDSVQSRAIPFITMLTSNPELEAALKVWEMFETLHSYSYTYLIKNVYSDPTAVFDSILEDDEIMKRALSVTKYYDDLIASMSETNEYERKKKLYLTLVSVNILEGIRFYVSFACSYSFAESGKMEGNAKIISLINRDENLHLATGTYLLRQLRTVEEEGFLQIVEDCEEQVIQMYRDAAQEEIEWAQYLFKDGSILGLNEEILTRYMMWITNKRMEAVGLPTIFERIQNPINWIDSWTSSKGVQVAPQETEIESYKIGSFQHDLHNVDYDLMGFDD